MKILLHRTWFHLIRSNSNKISLSLNLATVLRCGHFYLQQYIRIREIHTHTNKNDIEKANHCNNNIKIPEKKWAN